MFCDRFLRSWWIPGTANVATFKISCWSDFYDWINIVGFEMGGSPPAKFACIRYWQFRWHLPWSRVHLSRKVLRRVLSYREHWRHGGLRRTVLSALTVYCPGEPQQNETRAEKKISPSFICGARVPLPFCSIASTSVFRLYLYFSWCVTLTTVTGFGYGYVWVSWKGAVFFTVCVSFYKLSMTCNLGACLFEYACVFIWVVCVCMGCWIVASANPQCMSLSYLRVYMCDSCPFLKMKWLCAFTVSFHVLLWVDHLYSKRMYKHGSLYCLCAFPLKLRECVHVCVCVCVSFCLCGHTSFPRLMGCEGDLELQPMHLLGLGSLGNFVRKSAIEAPQSPLQEFPPAWQFRKHNITHFACTCRPTCSKECKHLCNRTHSLSKDEITGIKGVGRVPRSCCLGV